MSLPASFKRWFKVGFSLLGLAGLGVSAWVLAHEEEVRLMRMGSEFDGIFEALESPDDSRWAPGRERIGEFLSRYDDGQERVAAWARRRQQGKDEEWNPRRRAALYVNVIGAELTERQAEALDRLRGRAHLALAQLALKQNQEVPLQSALDEIIEILDTIERLDAPYQPMDRWERRAHELALEAQQSYVRSAGSQAAAGEREAFESRVREYRGFTDTEYYRQEGTRLRREAAMGYLAFNQPVPAWTQMLRVYRQELDNYMDAYFHALNHEYELRERFAERQAPYRPDQVRYFPSFTSDAAVIGDEEQDQGEEDRAKKLVEQGRLGPWRDLLVEGMKLISSNYRLAPDARGFAVSEVHPLYFNHVERGEQGVLVDEFRLYEFSHLVDPVTRDREYREAWKALVQDPGSTTATRSLDPLLVDWRRMEELFTAMAEMNRYVQLHFEHEDLTAQDRLEDLRSELAAQEGRMRQLLSDRELTLGIAAHSGQDWAGALAEQVVSDAWPQTEPERALQKLYAIVPSRLLHRQYDAKLLGADVDAFRRILWGREQRPPPSLSDFLQRYRERYFRRVEDPTNSTATMEVLRDQWRDENVRREDIRRYVSTWARPTQFGLAGALLGELFLSDVEYRLLLFERVRLPSGVDYDDEAAKTHPFNPAPTWDDTKPREIDASSEPELWWQVRRTLTDAWLSSFNVCATLGQRILEVERERSVLTDSPEGGPSWGAKRQTLLDFLVTVAHCHERFAERFAATNRAFLNRWRDEHQSADASQADAARALVDQPLSSYEYLRLKHTQQKVYNFLAASGLDWARLAPRLGAEREDPAHRARLERMRALERRRRLHSRLQWWAERQGLLEPDALADVDRVRLGDVVSRLDPLPERLATRIPDFALSDMDREDARRRLALAEQDGVPLNGDEVLELDRLKHGVPGDANAPALAWILRLERAFAVLEHASHDLIDAVHRKFAQLPVGGRFVNRWALLKSLGAEGLAPRTPVGAEELSLWDASWLERYADALALARVNAGPQAARGADAIAQEMTIFVASRLKPHLDTALQPGPDGKSLWRIYENLYQDFSRAMEREFSDRGERLEAEHDHLLLLRAAYDLALRQFQDTQRAAHAFQREYYGTPTEARLERWDIEQRNRFPDRVRGVTRRVVDESFLPTLRSLFEQAGAAPAVLPDLPFFRIHRGEGGLWGIDGQIVLEGEGVTEALVEQALTQSDFWRRFQRQVAEPSAVVEGGRALLDLPAMALSPQRRVSQLRPGFVVVEFELRLLGGLESRQRALAQQMDDLRRRFSALREALPERLGEAGLLNKEIAYYLGRTKQLTPRYLFGHETDVEVIEVQSSNERLLEEAAQEYREASRNPPSAALKFAAMVRLAQVRVERGMFEQAVQDLLTAVTEAEGNAIEQNPYLPLDETLEILSLLYRDPGQARGRPLGPLTEAPDISLVALDPLVTLYQALGVRLKQRQAEVRWALGVLIERQARLIEQSAQQARRDQDDARAASLFDRTTQRFTDAADVFLSVMRASPGVARYRDASLRAGEALLAAGEKARVVETYLAYQRFLEDQVDVLPEKDPVFGRMLTQGGKAAMEIGRYQTAIDMLTQAIAMNERLAQAYDFQQGNPETYPAYFYLPFTYQRRGKTAADTELDVDDDEQALRLYDQHILKNPRLYIQPEHEFWMRARYQQGVILMTRAQRLEGAQAPLDPQQARQWSRQVLDGYQATALVFDDLLARPAYDPRHEVMLDARIRRAELAMNLGRLVPDPAQFPVAERGALDLIALLDNDLSPAAEDLRRRVMLLSANARFFAAQAIVDPARAAERSRAFEAALSMYEQFANRHRDHALALWALAQQAECRDALGESREARKVREMALKKADSLPVEAYRNLPDGRDRAWWKQYLAWKLKLPGS